MLEGVLVALWDHDHVELLGQGGREGVKQLLVDGAPTVTEDNRHLGEVDGAMVAAEVGEDVVVDHLVTVVVTVPPVVDHSDN